MSEQPQAVQTDFHWSDLLLAVVVIIAAALVTWEVMERFEPQISHVMERGLERTQKWLDF